VIPITHHNTLVNALKDDFVPRDTTTRAATDIAGDLGTATYRWDNGYIKKLYIGTAADSLTIEQSTNDLVITNPKASGDIILDAKVNHTLKVDGVTKAVIDTNGIDGQYMKALSVDTASIAANAVTRAKMVAVGQQVSNEMTTFSTTNTVTLITDGSNSLTATITTTGRPVMLLIINDSASNDGQIYLRTGIGVTTYGVVRFKRDSTIVSRHQYRMDWDAAPTGTYEMPIVLPYAVDTPGAGTYTYTVEAGTDNAGTTFLANRLKLFVYEL
jgi:hypothetical protein